MSENKPKVLLVDDEPSNLDVLGGLLSAECYVVVAKSGEQALARASDPSRPELILLDVMMPGMDGYEVCQRLKAQEATRDIPVMFVTALDGVSDETKGLELGAVDFISKPIDQPIVLARVRGVLARQRLQRQLDEMQQRFSAMVVHDLRHPLAVIRGFAELARDEPAVVALPDLLSWMERILQSADRASELVSQMLDVSQLRAGRVTLKRSSLDLSRLLGQLVQDQGLLARARQLRLESAVEPGLVVDADESRLVEVLVNLIGNAMKFTPPGGRIELVAERREQDGICVSVSDTGPGIPPEHRANLFAPWEQAPNQDAAKVKGYGLGLAICRLIVQAHGGRIRIADNAGGGARFEFSLPVEQAAG